MLNPAFRRTFLREYHQAEQSPNPYNTVSIKAPECLIIKVRDITGDHFTASFVSLPQLQTALYELMYNIFNNQSFRENYSIPSYIHPGHKSHKDILPEQAVRYLWPGRPQERHLP